MAKKSTNGKKKKAARKPPEEETKSVRLEINHVFPDNLVTSYANHFTVQIDEHDCRLSFFNLELPLYLRDEQLEELQKLTEVDAVCVGKIAMSASRAPSVVRAMLNNLKKHMPSEYDLILNEIGHGEETENGDD